MSIEDSQRRKSPPKHNLMAVGKELYSIKGKTQLQKYDSKAGIWTSLGHIQTQHLGTSINYNYVVGGNFVVSEWTLVEGVILGNHRGLISVGISSHVSSKERLVIWEYSKTPCIYLAPKFDNPIIPVEAVHGLAKGLLLVGSRNGIINTQKITPLTNTGVVSLCQQVLVPATNFVPRHREWTASFLCGSNLVMIGLPFEGFVFNIDHKIWTTIALAIPSDVPTAGSCFQYDGRFFMCSGQDEGGGQNSKHGNLFEFGVDEDHWICWRDDVDVSNTVEYPQLLTRALKSLYTPDGTNAGSEIVASLNPKFNLHSYVIALFRYRQGSDIVFLVDTQDVPAHKYFVVGRCPYFAALIDGSWKKEESTQPIVLADFTCDSFSIFLEFQYTGRIGSEVLKNGRSYSIELAKKCLEDADRICFHEYAFSCVEWAARYLKKSQFPDYFRLLQKLDYRDDLSNSSYINQFWEATKKRFTDQPFEYDLVLVQCPGDPDITFLVGEQKIGADRIICSRFSKLADLICEVNGILEIDVPNLVWTTILRYVYTDKLEIPSDIYTLTNERYELGDRYLEIFSVQKTMTTANDCKDATEFWGGLLRAANLAGIQKIKQVASDLFLRRAKLCTWDLNEKEICQMLVYADEGKSFELWQNVVSFVHADRERITSEHITNLKVSHPSTAFRIMECGWNITK